MAHPDRMTVAQYRASMQGSATAKYHNQAVVVDGLRFDSRLEAKRYQQLKLLKAAGEVAWFTRQVPFVIAPKVTYRVDFLIVWTHRNPELLNVRMGNQVFPVSPVTLEDVKGFWTETSKVKVRTVEYQYGVTIQMLGRKDIG